MVSIFPEGMRRAAAGGTYVVGIDLGTTYSAAAVARDSGVETVTLGTVASAIPSVVVLRADGEVLVGEAAERRSVTEPTRTAREFKRRLGDPVPIILGGTPYGAEALMARLLHAVVQAVAEREGGAPARIIITHPANYGPYKKDLLAEMVRLADVRPVEFLSEPEAAAIDYLDRERLEAGEVVAVYDFGGGTFDAAVLRRTDDGFDLLGTPEGMERLGGIDFDQAIFAHVNQAVGGLLGEADASNEPTRAALARLRADCRTAKESLSSDTDVTIPVLLPNLQTEVRLTRTEFEGMIRPRIAETIAALERAVRSAGIAMTDVARVLLVGGSSRIPLVRETVRQATARPVAVDAHPKFAIALGAARFGAVRSATATATATATETSTPVETGLAPGLPTPGRPNGEVTASPAPVPASVPEPQHTASSARGRPRFLMLAGGVLSLAVLIVAALVVMPLFTGGEGGELKTRIPAGVWASCRASDPPDGATGAVAAVRCSPGGSITAGYVLFEGAAQVRAQYEASRQRNGVLPNSGPCSVDDVAESQYPSDGSAAGERHLCYRDAQGNAWIEWSAPDSRVWAYASTTGRDRGALYDFFLREAGPDG